MGLPTSLAIYSIVWWVVLFTVLPLGVVSHAEAGIKTPGGGDPGSPVNPKLARKFLTTTWVSLLIFAPFWIAVRFHWLTLDMLRDHG
jgi:predicted secreted protein